MSPNPPALSVVIPLSGDPASVERVVPELAALAVEGGLEVVLVDDGGPEETRAACRRILATAAVPVTVVDLARAFSIHNALLAGLREARGQWVVTMDADGRNPPAEVLRLFAAARSGGFDAVFGEPAKRPHSAGRSGGHWFADRIAGWVLDKPRGLHLSSFRCLHRRLVDEIARYEGPHPYLDGLILQSTRHLFSLTVAPGPRGHRPLPLLGRVQLGLRLLVNFSVRPLRVATLFGLAMGALGLAGLVGVTLLFLTDRGPAFGWGSLIAALFLFSGAQMVMLGLIGEYLGRVHLNINRRPQAVVREIWRGGAAGR
jgi:glycosyltransferase involved in cell wall biosynthesis